MIMLVINDEKMMELGRKHGLTNKKALAQRVGTSPNNIAHWSSNHRRLSMVSTRTINSLATFFIEECGEDLQVDDLVMFVEVSNEEE